MAFYQTLPYAQVQNIVNHFKGVGDRTVPALIEDAYDVVGYGLYMTLGSSSLHLSACPCPDDRTAQIAVLERACTPDGLSGAGFDWNAILAIVLRILNELVSTPRPA